MSVCAPTTTSRPTPMTRRAVFGRFSSVLMISPYSRWTPVSTHGSITPPTAGRVRLVLGRGMRRGRGPALVPATIRRRAGVPVLPVRTGLLRDLQGRERAIECPADRGQRGWICNLTLEASELQLVSGNRLLETILHIGGRCQVVLLGRLHQLRGIVELVVKRVERAAGQVYPVTGKHRLRLGEPRLGELEMEGQLVRRTEGERPSDLLPGALQWIQGGIRQAIGGCGHRAGPQEDPSRSRGEHPPPHGHAPPGGRGLGDPHEPPGRAPDLTAPPRP